jgi:hypothetical protein
MAQSERQPTPGSINHSTTAPESRAQPGWPEKKDEIHLEISLGLTLQDPDRKLVP